MKKLSMLCVILAFGLSVHALPGTEIGMVQAKTMINKTNEIIFIARKELRTHHVYNGDFTRAVHFQQYAIQQFRERKYTKAFYQSLVARYYANLSINANTGNNRLFINTLSNVEQKIVIDDTSAGINNPWPGQNAKAEKRNNFFVTVATNEARKEWDHVGVDVNQDEALKDGDLQIEDQ